MEASCELDTGLYLSRAVASCIQSSAVTVINLQQDKYRVDTATAGQGPVLQQAE